MREETYMANEDKKDAPEDLNEPPEIKSAIDKGWYYAAGGSRHGPVSAQAIGDLLKQHEIEPDVQVWRKGMSDWVNIRESELGGLVSSEPPPVSSHFVTNLVVWIIAVLPLGFGIINASITQQNLANQIMGVPDLQHGGPLQSAPISVLIIAVINAILCVIDVNLLKRAGYDAQWLGAIFWGFFLAPVYLFFRARRLKQRPYYAILWIVMAIVGAIIQGAAGS
jgi:hypothetical protein